MKFRIFSLLAIFLLIGLAHGQERPPLNDPKEKESYVIGLDIGRALKKQGLEIDPDRLAQGVRDSMSGQKFLLTDSEIQETMVGLQKRMAAREAEEVKKLSEKNKKEGVAFLAENKKKEGIQTLPSGLQYKIIKSGNGKRPQKTDMVTTHYRGTFINGTEFDSSYRRGKPATFPVNGVIPGWTEALQLMDEGAKWQIFLPPHLAYGERGAGREIGPHAVLVFEIELISIQGGK